MLLFCKRACRFACIIRFLQQKDISIYADNLQAIYFRRKETLLDNIRRLCSESGITLTELESKAGLGKNTIYKWDSVNPSIDKVYLVAKALGVTIEELIA